MGFPFLNQIICALEELEIYLVLVKIHVIFAEFEHKVVVVSVNPRGFEELV